MRTGTPKGRLASGPAPVLVQSGLNEAIVAGRGTREHGV